MFGLLEFQFLAKFSSLRRRGLIAIGWLQLHMHGIYKKYA